MEAFQQELDKIHYDGYSGDRKVHVQLNGMSQLSACDIDASLLNAASKEALQRDVIEAVNAAMASMHGEIGMRMQDAFESFDGLSGFLADGN